MPQGVSSHGLRFEHKPVGGVYTVVAELGDFTDPGFTRKDFDITSHNRDIDTYVVGVLRREAVAFPMFFNKAIASQVALRAALFNSDATTNMTNGFRITAPDGGVLTFSGGVTGFTQTHPVDGVQTANVTIRATGSFVLDGVEYGA